MSKVERLLKLLFGTIAMIFGGIMILTSTVAFPISLVFLPPGLAIFYSSVQMAQDGLIGNYIKNSCFIIDQNKKLSKKHPEKVNRIGQNLFSLKQMMASRKDKDKTRFFALEAVKCFEQLPKESNGELIKYGFTSHVYTLMLLKKMHKLGYVNITYNDKSDSKSNLFIERLALGVAQRKRHVTLYDIAFTLTDKDFDSQAISEVLEVLGIDISNYERTYTKKGHSLFKINKNISKPLDGEKEAAKNSLTSINNKKYKLYRTFPFLARKKEDPIDYISKLEKLRELRDGLVNDTSATANNQTLSDEQAIKSSK